MKLISYFLSHFSRVTSNLTYSIYVQDFDSCDISIIIIIRFYGINFQQFSKFPIICHVRAHQDLRHGIRP